jgi:hypothetical protein
MAYLEFFASITRLAVATRRVYDAITTSVALNRHIHAPLRQAVYAVYDNYGNVLPPLLRAHPGSAHFIQSDPPLFQGTTTLKEYKSSSLVQRVPCVHQLVEWWGA